MYADVMHVGIHTECYEQIAVQEPSHDSSSSVSIRRTVSAVTGSLPREITKPLRFAGRRERREPSLAPPGKERRSSRFTAALMVQSSALASDFARA
jgi:hypothetical protein